MKTVESPCVFVTNHFLVSMLETLWLNRPHQYDIDAWSNGAYEKQSLPNLIFCWHSTKKNRYLKSESERNLVLGTLCCISLLSSACLWSKVPMFQRVGMEEVWGATPTSISIFEPCDIKTLWFESGHIIFTGFKMPTLRPNLNHKVFIL